MWEAFEKPDSLTCYSVHPKDPNIEKRKFEGKTPRPILQWAAFFGNCKHEINPVKFGVRLSLSYSLYRVDKPCVPSPPPGLLTQYAPQNID